MDNRYLDIVVKEMQPFFDEQGFKAQETEGLFKSDKKAVAIEYDEARQMYLLKIADIAEDGSFEPAECSAWLFDDSQNEKDAEAVGIDFTSTLRDYLGVKRTRTFSAAAGSVDLPTVSKGDAYNVNAFTKKMLDIFPTLKDDYKDHKAQYGNFLYLNFFGEKLVPQIKELLHENNKKSVKKLFDALQTGYLQGDRDTVNTIVAVVAAACADDQKALDNAKAALEENKHFTDAVTEFIPVIKKNKKLSAALLK